MLQVYKNQLITDVSKRQSDLRQLELEYYTNNLWTLSSSSTLFCGFAFAQLSTPLPSSMALTLECPYLLLTASTLAIHLCVVICTTFCCIWAPGLALKGTKNSLFL